MTTEPTPPVTDADVVAAAGEVRAVWQAKEFSDNHHRYMIARLEYEWPTLARAIKRLTSTHEDATRCPSEYDGAGYEAGTVSCDRGRDHAGQHEGEGYDSERYTWQPARTYCYQKGAADHQGACLHVTGHAGDHRDSQGNTWQQVADGETLLDHEDAQRMNVGGRPPLHDPAARPVPAQPQPCGALRPFDPKNTSCTLGAWHFGMHHNRDGNVAYQWDGDGRDLPTEQPR